MGLDPAQTQVALFLAKLLEKPAQDSSAFLDQARADWKNGNTEQALAELEDYLNDHSDDEAALKLKKHIEASIGAKKRRKPRAEAAPVQAPIPTPVQAMASQDQQAQADEAYNLGLDSYRKGDYAAARKFWEQTLKIQPNHLQAKRNMERLNRDHPAQP
jgi:Tfp pilus assembly protein PilF